MVPVSALEALKADLEKAIDRLGSSSYTSTDHIYRDQAISAVSDVVDALISQSREEAPPPHPQIVRFGTFGDHVVVRRDALEYLENQITLAPPAAAGTEQTHAGNPDVYRHSGATRKVIGNVVADTEGSGLSHEAAIREVHDYLADLSDEEFYRLLDEHANGDFAIMLKETGALLARREGDKI